MAGVFHVGITLLSKLCRRSRRFHNRFWASNIDKEFCLSVKWLSSGNYLSAQADASGLVPMDSGEASNGHD